MAGSNSFVWHWTPSRGHSGGLLLGTKVDNVEIEEVHKAEFFIGVLIRNKQSNFRF